MQRSSDCYVGVPKVTQVDTNGHKLPEGSMISDEQVRSSEHAVAESARLLVFEDTAAFAELWRIVLDGTHGASPGFSRPSNWFCYFDVHEIVEVLPVSHAAYLDFAGRTYSHCLLSQVYHHYFYKRNGTLPKIRPSARFPEITGILGAYGSHVCPALLPTMLLYFNPSMLIATRGRNSVCGRSGKRIRGPYSGLESDTWRARSTNFDRHVNRVTESLPGYLYMLWGEAAFWALNLQDKRSGRVLGDRIHQQYLDAHHSLSKQIADGDSQGRMMNGYAVYPSTSELDERRNC